MLRHPHLATLPALLLSLASTAAHGAVNDIFPSDYVALKDGTLNGTYYLSHRRQEGPIRDGKRLFDGAIDTDLAAIRMSYHMDVGTSSTFAPLVVLSWADSDASSGRLSRIIGDEATGMADLRVGGSFWFHRDREKREFLGVSLVAMLPTGHYNDKRVINIGENRWKWVLGGGMIWPLGEKWIVDISPEVAWYGDNDDYAGNRKLEQDVSYALTSYLRYRITPQFHLYAGLQFNRGGETAINGVDQDNAPDNQRTSFGLLYLTPGRDQWQLRYSRDSSIDNGFKTEDEIALRYSVLF